MEENANIEHRMSNVELRSEENNTSATSMFNVGRSMFDVRVVLQLSVILIAGLFIYGYRLGDSPLDRTEPFRALVAHQMAAGGDWLIPRLYGEVYLRKPPLIYWFEAGAEKLAGRGNELIWRLPSAVGSALLAVYVAWWSARWFGERARLPGGFACLALVALWDQNRGADIDALNTVFAVVTSLCVLELMCGVGRETSFLAASGRDEFGVSDHSDNSALRAAAKRGFSQMLWTAGLGLSLGATLLLKGPGGLPQIIGAIVGPPIFLRNWRLVRKSAVAIGLMIGFAIFAAYVVAAKLAMARAGIVPDHTGWYEVIEKIFLHGWTRRTIALLMPAELLVFALPVSVVLPFVIVLIRRMPADDPRRMRTMAILGTLVVTAVIWMLVGNDNPRYEYVMLPLLAPLAGFVWAAWDWRDRQLLHTLAGICVLICAAEAVIVLKMPHAGVDRWVMAGGLSISVILVLCLGIVLAKPLAAKAASPVAVVLLLVLLAIPMGERKNAERRRKSSRNPAVVLRQMIGNATRVSAAGVVRDLPELFYYANVDVDSFGEFGLPKLAAARGGHWVVISENEKYPAYSTIEKYIPGAFPRGVTKLPMPDPRDQIYVGWYDPPANADTRIKWNVEKSVEPED